MRVLRELGSVSPGVASQTGLRTGVYDVGLVDTLAMTKVEGSSFHHSSRRGRMRQRRRCAMNRQQRSHCTTRSLLAGLTFARSSSVGSGSQCTIISRVSQNSADTKTPSRMAAATDKGSRGVEAPRRSSGTVHGMVVIIAGILDFLDCGYVNAVEQRSSAQLNSKPVGFRGNRLFAAAGFSVRPQMLS